MCVVYNVLFDPNLWIQKKNLIIQRNEKNDIFFLQSNKTKLNDLKLSIDIVEWFLQQNFEKKTLLFCKSAFIEQTFFLNDTIIYENFCSFSTLLFVYKNDDHL